MSVAETAAVASAAASSVAAVNSESTLEPGLEETGPSTAPVQRESLSKPTDSSTPTPLSISVSVSAAAISSVSSIIATEANSCTTGEAEPKQQEHNSSEHSVDVQHAKHSMTTRTPSSPLPSMSSVSKDSGAAVKQELDSATAFAADVVAEADAPSSSAPTSSSTAASPAPLSPSPLSSTMITIDKGHPIPTSNALSSSLKSRLSASAPLSSLSSVTPTTIISPKPYSPFTPASTSSLSSFSKSDPTQRARGASSAYSAYPTPGSKHDDIHIKSPSPTDNRQHSLHRAADEVDQDEGVESEEEYEVVEEEEYEAMEGYSELESESGTVLGMERGSGHPDEQDTDMVDVSAGSSSPPLSAKHPTLPSSSAAGRERPVSPGSPSTVASGDGPFSISAGGSGSKSPSPRLAPQQPDAAESPRSVKSPGGGLKKDTKVGVTATTCANCGTTSTPLWRRASDGQTICNACGLYFKARNLTRPPWLKRNMVLKKDEEGEDTEGQASSSTSAAAPKDGAVAGSSPSNASEKSAEETQQLSTTAATDEKEKPTEVCPGDGSCKANGGQPCTTCAGVTQQQTGRQNLVCANCRTTTTPLWRRDSSGNTICNACGLYFKLHNVHRPVTMKRAVIKRRKRVNVLANSPPLVPQQAMQQQQQQQQRIQQQQQQQRMQHPSHPHPHPHHQPPPQYHQRLQYPKPLPLARPRSPPAVSSIEPNGHDGQGDHSGSAAKRRRIQSSNDPRGEEYILPKPPVNGQPDWSRSGNHRRSMSPIENIGSSEQDHHHPGPPHHQGSPYSQPSSRGQDPHGHMRDHPPHSNQPPRYSHHGSGQYVPQSMTMSRYPMYPPPPPRMQQQGPPPPLQQHSHPSQQHPQSSHSHVPPPHSQHHQPPHHMHHQAPHGYPQSAHSPRDMDDGMHPSSQHSSGWNQRLPGYATVSSSSSNTRLSSTGIVHSTGPPPSSPPLYPRYSHGGSQASYHHQQYYGQGSSQQGHDYHPSEASQSQASAPPPPPAPPSQGGHHYSSGSSPVQGAAVPSGSGYATPYSERERGGSSSNGAGGPTHLPPISLPHPAHAGHHQALPRPTDLMHPADQAPSSSHHHQFSQHRRQPSSPPMNMNGVAIGAPGNHPPPPPAAPTAPSAHAGITANTDVLQQTRQDLQREVSHLSMLLGRAAAVLSGLDQALDPHIGAAQPPPAAHPMHEGGSPISHGYAAPPHPPPPSHGHGGPMHSSAAPQAGAPGPLTSDVTTNSALASLMALSSSGGPGHAGVSARHDDREMQHHHGLPPPPPRYPQSMSYSSYPLPRRP